MGPLRDTPKGSGGNGQRNQTPGIKYCWYISKLDASS
jgi:hypothetical protein